MYVSLVGLVDGQSPLEALYRAQGITKAVNLDQSASDGRLERHCDEIDLLPPSPVLASL